MAMGPDPDAPDWFEPEPGGDNGAAEAKLAAAPATGERSEEREVVYADDLSPDEDVRGGATTDTEAEIIEASREFDAAEAAEFKGDIPGFTDWREELRDRLKTIRARREQERLAEDGDGGDAESDAADQEDAAEKLVVEEPAAEVVGFAAALRTDPADLDSNLDLAPSVEPGADSDFTPDTETPVVDPDVDLSEAFADDAPATLILGEKNAEASVPDAEELDDLVAAPDAEDLDNLVAAPDAEGLDDLVAAEASPLPGEDTAADAVTEPLDAFGGGDAAAEETVPAEAIDAFDLVDPVPGEGVVALDGEIDAPDVELDPLDVEVDAPDVELDPLDVEVDAPDAEEEDLSEAFEAAPDDRELPEAVMPDLPAIDAAPELDFDDVPAALATPPEIDLATVEEREAPALEWDSEEVGAAPTAVASAGPLGERAAAALCDMLVLTAIGAALVGAASSGTGVPFRQVLGSEALWLGLAWSIFAVGYSVFFVGSCGQTIGRMIMRLRVVGDDQFSVGFDRAAIRLAAWVPSALPLLAGLLPALRDPQRRGLHDRLSHTRVVKA